MRSTKAPASRSGTAHGVELSIGQETVISDGAASVPLEAMIAEYPAGTLMVRVSDLSPVYCSSQRSLPAGSAEPLATFSAPAGSAATIASVRSPESASTSSWA